MEANELIAIFTQINDEKKMKQFFSEIFTDAELKDFVLRWELMKKLKKGDTQRQIAVDLGVSTCKITRGAKILKNPDSMTSILLKSYRKEKK